eukprot:5757465-Amphidinium_carterae.1
MIESGEGSMSLHLALAGKRLKRVYWCPNRTLPPKPSKTSIQNGTSSQHKMRQKSMFVETVLP